MRLFARYIILLLFVATALGEDFRLQIVPSKVSESENYIDGTSTLGPFFVVLTNTSSSDKYIFRDWCSRGYVCLTFTITRPGEKSFEITPPGRGWTMNYADTYLIKKGEHYVWSIDLFKKPYWQGFPANWNTSGGGFGNRNKQVSIQANFSISDNCGNPKIWLGKISSTLMPVTLCCPDIVTEQGAAANP
jgi:hypothetical protein